MKIARRWFLEQCGVGLGSVALASLAAREAAAAGYQNPLRPKAPHHPAKAKRVIFLFMAGAPSQLDLFDHKPALKRYDGKPAPASLVKDQMYAFIKPDAALFASPFRFDKKGESGAELSEV